MYDLKEAVNFNNLFIFKQAFIHKIIFCREVRDERKTERNQPAKA